MATLDWSLSRTDGVTFVELYVTSDTATRIRIESTLEPVWPPRRQGVPEAGWTGTAYEGQVADNRRLVVGYATPAEPTEPPAEMTELGTQDTEEAVSVRDVVRSLGDCAPPQDVIPDDENASQPPQNSSREQTAHQRTGHRQRESDIEENPSQYGRTERWLDELEQRIATAEQLTAVESVADAQSAVESVGGISEIHSLQTQLDADRERLEQVQRRTAEYDSRLDSLDMPLSRLERIA